MSRMKLLLPPNRTKSHNIYADIVVERTGKIYNAATNTIEISGVIDDWFGVSTVEVAEALQEMDESQPLNVRINSPGGIVYEAIAIHNLIAEWPSEVVTHVVSLAASAATVIAMVGDVRKMSDNAEFMVHNPWTIAIGNAEEFRSVANHLDRVGENLVKMYSRKTKLEEDAIRYLMAGPENEDGTYLSADEALNAGFITEIVDTSRTSKEDAAIRNTAYRRVLAKIKLA